LKFAAPTFAAASFVTLLGKPKQVGRKVESYLSPWARVTGASDLDAPSDILLLVLKKLKHAKSYIEV
jgi:hypothetical protein